MGSGKQKRIALFSALAGYGRCSLTIALPVISKLHVECCPLPTSILSTNSAFKNYIMEDYSDRLKDYIAHWKSLNLHFDGICTGFLGSVNHIEIVQQFLTMFRTDATCVIVDPVLGDHGTLYSSCSQDLCVAMRKLIDNADLITPNLTEACLLTDTPYISLPSAGELATAEETGLLIQLEQLCSGLRNVNRNLKIVITGIGNDNFVANYISVPGRKPSLLKSKRDFADRNGTGDLFTSILAADAVNGVSLERSVERAQNFIVKCLEASDEHQVERFDGVCFEYLLDELT